jgi:DNA-binding HxlR family transcriptional regulator
MRKQRHNREDLEACPMEATLDLIGGKWKGVILFRLSQRMYRFNELNRTVCQITARSLTKQLRELEADGLVTRTVYAEVPPRVEYTLTEKGRSLTPILALMKEWGETFVLGHTSGATSRAEDARLTPM